MENNKYKPFIDAIQKQGREITEQELYKDKLWIESSKRIYKMDNNQDFKGSDQDAVKYGLDRMAKFNYNVTGTHLSGQIAGTIPDAVAIKDKDMDTKIAFAYLMDTYDDKNPTWAGFGRAMSEIGQDALTWMGVGVGKAASKGAQSVAKEALKKTLFQEIKSHMMKPVAQGAMGGATFAGGFNVAEQQVKTQAGLQKQISKKEALQTAGVGATLGAGLVKGVQLAGKGIDKAGQKIQQYAQEGEQEMMKMAGGGTPKALYSDSEKYHQIIPEIKYLNPKDLKVIRSGEVSTVSDEVAQNMDFSEPVEISLFADGTLGINDGHHRVAAAKKLGLEKIPVKLQSINAKGYKINELLKETK